MSKRKPLDEFNMGAFLSGKKIDTGPVPESGKSVPDKNRIDTGPVPEKLPTRPTVIRLDARDHEALEREAHRRGTSIAGIIRSLVREHLRGME